MPTWARVLERCLHYTPWRPEHLEVDAFGGTIPDVCARVCAYVGV
jgi:hypothetical protein